MESSVQSSPSPAVVAAGIFEALGHRDLDALEGLQHDEVVDDFIAVGIFRGRKAVRGFFEELFGALPDATLAAERIHADGQFVTVQWQIAGIFSGGPFQGIRATGRRVTLRGVDVMHIVDSRLLDNTIYYDGLSFARQIGLLPTAGSRADRALISAFNAQTVARSAMRLPPRRR